MYLVPTPFQHETMIIPVGVGHVSHVLLNFNILNTKTVYYFHSKERLTSVREGIGLPMFSFFVFVFLLVLVKW